MEGIQPESGKSAKERAKEQSRQARLAAEAQRFHTNPDVMAQLEEKKKGEFNPEHPSHH